MNGGCLPWWCRDGCGGTQESGLDLRGLVEGDASAREEVAFPGKPLRERGDALDFAGC